MAKARLFGFILLVLTPKHCKALPTVGTVPQSKHDWTKPHDIKHSLWGLRIQGWSFALTVQLDLRFRV